jgi:hypothetical protein
MDRNQAFALSDYSSKLELQPHLKKIAQQSVKVANEVTIFTLFVPDQETRRRYNNLNLDDTFGPYTTDCEFEQVSIGVQVMSDNSNLSASHAFECMKNSLKVFKTRFPWINEVIRFTDEVNYYSGSEFLCLVKQFNEFQMSTLSLQDRILIRVRAGNEAGHGKDAADRETNITKSVMTNAKHAGKSLTCASDLVKECEKKKISRKNIFNSYNSTNTNGKNEDPSRYKYSSQLGI